MISLNTSMNGALQASVSFSRASERLNQALQPGGDGNIVQPITDQIQAKHAHAANLASLKTASDMEKRLLDILV